MNIKVDYFSNYLTRTMFYNVVSSYIPKQLLEDFDKKKFVGKIGYILNDGADAVQEILDNSNNQLRMYGSAAELALYLRLYRNFPMSYKFFGNHSFEPYRSEVWKSIKSEEFISKHDLRVWMESEVCFVWKDTDLKVACGFTSIFFKTCDAQLDGCYEFVKYNPEFYSQFCQKLDQTMKDISITIKSERSKLEKYYLPSSKSDNSEIISIWESLIPNCNKKQKEDLRVTVSLLYKMFPIRTHPSLHAELTYICSTLFEMIREFMTARPEMFLPYTPTNIKNAPIVIRVFQAESHEFVMKCELFEAIRRKNPPGENIDFVDENGRYAVMELADVYKEYGDQISNINLIPTPVRRAEFKAVPIITSKGDYCILAIDAFSEIFNQLFFVEKVFQKIKNDDWNYLCDYMRKVEQFFKSDERFFVTIESLNKLKEETTEFWKKYEKVPVKYVRNAKKDGFTVENLKNELKNLGLNRIFPEIELHADRVYLSTIINKKDKFLRTCDLFFAISLCLLRCVHGHFDSTRALFVAQKVMDKERTSQLDYRNCPELRDKLKDVYNINPKKVVKEESVDEKSSCEDCVHTNKLYDQVKKELKSTQHTLRTAEKKAKKTDELEKKLASCQRKIEGFENKLDKERDEKKTVQESLEKQIEEINEEMRLMKEQVSMSSAQLEAKKLEVSQKNEEINKANKILTDTRKKLTSKTSKLGDEVKRKENQLESVRREVSNLQKKIDEKDEKEKTEISEKDEIIKRLEETNTRLTIRVEEQDRIVKSLLEKISDSNPSGIPEDKRHCEPRYQLSELWKIRDQYNSGEPLKQAKHMIQKLISLSNRADIHEMANYEYQQFEGKIRNYLLSVEVNIQKLKKNRECSELIPLSDLPAFSDRFMTEYWKEIHKKSEAIEESDVECGICFFEMKSEEEKLDCAQCKKVLHLKCATKWLAVHRSCPYCRAKLLDPIEFPSLN
ncbi:hypothetical protein CRE_21344 [Caenorhabditis remanei]|uniref:RING-type domain-containing protein n=1 Tax=Caenorhabditis remanei TaxID=31234 RepID=E3MUU8_CAERE|nr:hypothetical protein CRE_21344 [Caenorhabditis remanei]